MGEMQFPCCQLCFSGIKGSFLQYRPKATESNRVHLKIILQNVQWVNKDIEHFKT